MPAHWRAELKRSARVRCSDFVRAMLTTILLLLLLLAAWYGLLLLAGWLRTGFLAFCAQCWTAVSGWLFMLWGPAAAPVECSSTPVAAAAAAPAAVAHGPGPEFIKVTQQLDGALDRLAYLEARMKEVTAAHPDVAASADGAAPTSVWALQAQLDALNARVQALDAEARANHTASSARFETLHQEITTLDSSLREFVSTHVATAIREFRLADAENLKEELTLWLAAELGPYATKEYVATAVTAAIDQYHADMINLPDFALKSRGGCVVTDDAFALTSKTHRRSEPHNSITTEDGLRVVAPELGAPTDGRRTPLAVLHPGTNVGQCWCFSGTSGVVTLLLSEPVRVTKVSIDQPPAGVSGPVLTAPEDFEVRGLNSPASKSAVPLGAFQLKRAGAVVQTFDVDNSANERFSMVQVKVLSNHGNPDKTCLYRVRVHGDTESDME